MASIVLAGSQGLAVVGSVLLLADMLNIAASRGQVIAQSLDVVGDPLRAAGFAVVGAAFMGDRLRRVGRLRAGLILVGGGYGAWCLSDAARAVNYARTHAETTYVASHAALAVSDLFIAVAVGAAAVGFGIVPPQTTARVSGYRDYRVGWSSILLAAGVLFAAISSILFSVAFPPLGATSRFSAGFVLAAGGDAVAIGGPVIAAVALLGSARRQRGGGAGRLGRRDGLLAVATAVLAVGLAIAALGSMESTSAASINGFDGRSSTAAWLDVIRQFGWAAGIGVASVGFLRLWRSRRTMSSELRATVSAQTNPRRPKGRGRVGLAWVFVSIAVCGAAVAVFLAIVGGARSVPHASSSAPSTKPPPSAELSYGAFSQAAEAICRSGNSRATAVSSAISGNADAANAVALSEVITILRDGRSKLEALSGPGALEAARDALVKALDREIASAESASNAAKAGDQVSFDSALRQVAAETRQADAAGSKLGAPACATGP